jgi:T5orf172 domain
VGLPHDKIGSTTLPPEERARQLSTTGVPAPFQVIAKREFEDELRAERELQALFGGQRVDSRREFFEITIEEAQTALLRLSDAEAREPASSAKPPANNETTREKKPISNTNASVLESVRKHQAGLQSFRSMRRIEASRRNASALRLRFSQSLASLQQRLSQAKVRSTTQRRGSTTNPFV